MQGLFVNPASIRIDFMNILPSLLNANPLSLTTPFHKYDRFCEVARRLSSVALER